MTVCSVTDYAGVEIVHLPLPLNESITADVDGEATIVAPYEADPAKTYPHASFKLTDAVRAKMQSHGSVKEGEREDDAEVEARCEEILSKLGGRPVQIFSDYWTDRVSQWDLNAAESLRPFAPNEETMRRLLHGTPAKPAVIFRGAHVPKDAFAAEGEEAEKIAEARALNARYRIGQVLENAVEGRPGVIPSDVSEAIVHELVQRSRASGVTPPNIERNAIRDARVKDVAKRAKAVKAEQARQAAEKLPATYTLHEERLIGIYVAAEALDTDPTLKDFVWATREEDGSRTIFYKLGLFTHLAGRERARIGSPFVRFLDEHELRETTVAGKKKILASARPTMPVVVADALRRSNAQVRDARAIDRSELTSRRAELAWCTNFAAEHRQAFLRGFVAGDYANFIPGSINPITLLAEIAVRGKLLDLESAHAAILRGLAPPVDLRADAERNVARQLEIALAGGDRVLISPGSHVVKSVVAKAVDAVTGLFT